MEMEDQMKGGMSRPIGRVRGGSYAIDKKTKRPEKANKAFCLVGIAQ